MHRAHDVQRWTRRLAAILPGRLCILFVTLALLVPALAGGTPYVWCAGMNRAQMTCCCHGAHSAGHAKLEKPTAPSDQIEAACCVGRRVEAVPTSGIAFHSTLALSSPTVIAWLTLAQLIPTERAPESDARRRYDCEARAGPASPLYVRTRAYLN